MRVMQGMGVTLLIFTVVAGPVQLGEMAPSRWAADLTVRKATAQTNYVLHGHATAVDGDELQLHTPDGDEFEIRLDAIDAPESDMDCGGWNAGQAAVAHLRTLIAGDTLLCRGHQVDRYGRHIMTCRTDRVGDLGRAMVTDGMAWAYRYYNTRYVVAEESAKESGVGIWARGCPRPVDHQQRHAPTNDG